MHLSTSCEERLNLDYLLARMWEKLTLVRAYTKKRGQYPDFSEGIILRNGSTVEHVVCFVFVFFCFSCLLLELVHLSVWKEW